MSTWTRLLLGSAMVAVVSVLAAALVVTWTRLNDTTDELRLTEESLSAQESVNASLEGTNQDLRRDISGLESDIAGLEEDVDGLQDDVALLEMGKATLERTVQGLESTNAELTEERDDAIARGDALLMDKEHLATDLAVARTNNESLLATNAGLHSDLSDARAENDNLEALNGELSGNLDTARIEYRTLQDAVGTVEELQSTADGVRGEIIELEDKLRPLILSWNSRMAGGFFCTGSMEPTLGCLDSVTWINEFDPSVIVKGTIISFNPNCWETDAEKDDVGTAHRVIDIRVVDGVYQFWPKGDGNEEEDGCWIPQSNVDSYAVEFFPNRYPQNSKLRLAVLNAWDAYRAVQDEYRALYFRYCGFPPSEERRCTLPDHRFREVDGLGDEATSAFATYECWYDVAKRSERPGHIPANMCGDQRHIDGA